MDIKEYYNSFAEDVERRKYSGAESDASCFLLEMTERMLNVESLPAEVDSYFFANRVGNHNVRIDGALLAENEYHLFVVDYNKNQFYENLTTADCDRLTKLVASFAEDSIRGVIQRNSAIDESMPEYGLAEDLKAFATSNTSDIQKKITLYILTNRNAEGGLREYRLKYEKICGLPVDRQIWDIERIHKIETSQQGRQAIEIDFSKYGIKGLPCIEAKGMDNNNFKSYLCIISGRVLADLYDDYGSRLLEGNVRSFLSTKVAVNKKIRNTIANEPERFFAYNNGISTTAMGLKFEEIPGEGRYITGVTDLQIINGGQTTASLSSARYKDKKTLDGIYVQMKLTEIDSGTTEIAELVRKISHSSNSQNKVSDADFFSVHPFHQKIEILSERCFAPKSSHIPYETNWFYERARGQYLQKQMRMTRTQRDTFLKKYPKTQLVTKTDFAKFRNSWEQLPHIVSKGAQTNFMKFSEVICGKDGSKEWESVALNYGDLYFKETIAIAIIFRTLESEISRQTWYQNSYRANIITYTIALFSRMVQNRTSNTAFSLMSVWEKQEVPKGLLNELLKIAKFVLNQITREDRSVVNVTQWCKQERCWELLKKAVDQENICVNFGILAQENVMKSTVEIERMNNEARTVGALEQGINVLSEVLNYKGWVRLREFATGRFDLTRDEEFALNCICAYLGGRGRSLPNEKGAKALWKLLQKSMDNGYQK